MEMRPNHVKHNLQGGKVSVGTWLSIPSPFSAERCGRLGFEWLVIDMEHNPISIDMAAMMIMAINQTPTAPMVRIPWNHPEHIKRVLDAGAWGIVVPMVCSKEEAEQAVEAAKYHPQGFRSNGGGRYELSFDADRATYTSRANDEIFVAVQIEHIDAVERAEEILSVPGVDACFIGPNDLMTSMGMLGKMDVEAPQVREAFEHVVQVSNKVGVAPGIHARSGADVTRRIKEGFRFIAMASEMGLMIAGLNREKALIEL
jgi:4-hydroxy-2-oxoheptanedioate aldolase